MTPISTRCHVPPHTAVSVPEFSSTSHTSITPYTHARFACIRRLCELKTLPGTVPLRLSSPCMNEGQWVNVLVQCRTAKKQRIQCQCPTDSRAEIQNLSNFESFILYVKKETPLFSIHFNVSTPPRLYKIFLNLISAAFQLFSSRGFRTRQDRLRQLTHRSAR